MAATAPYFSTATFTFLKDLAANNDRVWFEENRSRYEDHVRIPALRMIRDFAPLLAKISPHFQAGPRSIFRIHRDVRFSADKSPYKTHTGIQFRHDAGRDAHAPGFYLHVEPGNSFVGLGMWHPDGPSLLKVREHIVANPDAWRGVVGKKSFSGAFDLQGDRLVRSPKDFDPEHPLIEDLKWKDYIGIRPVPQTYLSDPDLPANLAATFAAGAPLVRFLCDAVGVPF